jgi:hypothetical protein
MDEALDVVRRQLVQLLCHANIGGFWRAESTILPQLELLRHHCKPFRATHLTNKEMCKTDSDWSESEGKIGERKVEIRRRLVSTLTASEEKEGW